MKQAFTTISLLIALLIISSNIVYPQDHAVLTFSEVMFRPSASNSEFIEIYNGSDTAVVELHGYKIKYHTSKADNIIGVDDSTLLQPGQYAVLFENDYDIQTGIYQDIPENALVLKIEDNAFGSSGMSNSSDRTIYLLNSREDTVDIYTYTADNSAGISDEKIDYQLSDVNSNWSNTKVLNGTPGEINSVTPKEYDLAIIDVTKSNHLIIENDSLEISISIKNLGTEIADDFSLSVFDDKDFDFSAHESEQIFNSAFLNLSAADSITTQAVIDSLQLRPYSIICRLDYTQDQDTTNNTYIINFDVLPEPNEYADIVINEIMHKPAGDEPEWVEIFNNTDEAVNLKKWKVADQSTARTVSEADNLIEPGGYIIISDDESVSQFYNIPSPVIAADLPSLNNSGDKLKLTDSLGFVIDSLEYLSAWGGSKGRSLERIKSTSSGNDSLNWTSSVSYLGATPGRINSVSPKVSDTAIDSIFIFPELPVEGEDVVLTISAKNTGGDEISNIIINLYEDLNIDSSFTPDEMVNSSIIPFIDSQETIDIDFMFFGVQVGEYNFIVDVVLEGDEYYENNTALYSFSVREKPVEYNSLLINEIMYKPNDDEPEWIEIYNNTAEAIDLDEWGFADSKDTIYITDTNLYVEPAGFLVLSDDESLIEFYETASPVLEISLPSLNNSGDNLKIIDPFLRTIDSVNYLSSWGGSAGGRSLERKLYYLPGNDSTNWDGSISLAGASPGERNSVVPKDYDLIISEISWDAVHVILGSEIVIQLVVNNIGLGQIDTYRIEVFNDMNSDSLADPSELETTIFGATINPSDSTTNSFQLTNFQAGINQLIFVITTQPEDFTANNTAFISFNGIQLNEARNDIVINEIMYSPVSPEPEWIELYNNSNKLIELNGYQICDASDTNRVIFESYHLHPQDYAIIAADSSMLEIYPDIKQVFIASLPALNNSSDRIILLDSLDRVIDSLSYTSGWGGRRGYSLERISADGLSTDSTNWGASYPASTPGYRNTVTPEDYDLRISDLRTIPNNPIHHDQLILQATVKNAGKYPAGNFKVSFLGNANSLIDEVWHGALESGDSVIIQSANSFILDGAVSVIANIEYGADLNPNNNSDTLFVEPGHAQYSVIINEFMFNPLSGESEWIELLNVSGTSINIKNWTVSDVSPQLNNKPIITFDYILQPDDYLVIAKDTALFQYVKTANLLEVPFGSLGNSRDGIIISDIYGNVIDSIFYTDNWQTTKGLSLERRRVDISGNDSTNWIPSIDISGGTPGAGNSINSIFHCQYNLVVINEIMFAPAADNSEFVELLNIGDEAIDLGGWTYKEEGGSSYRISNSRLLHPDEYFVFAADSSILFNYDNLAGNEMVSILQTTDLGLSNSGERIVIKDAFGNVIDSLTYSDSWHNKNITDVKNRALERISPYLATGDRHNWSSSVADYGATPGMKNSIFTTKSATNSNLSIEPNPFSPDNDGFEDFTMLSYKLKSSVSQVRVKIYDDLGRLVRTLSNNMASGSSGGILFDGLDDSGRPLRIGMYIVFLEAIESTTGEVEAVKKVVVIARML